MTMRENPDHYTFAVTIAAFDEIRIDGRETVSYISGNAPHLFLRIGSDCVRIVEGQTLPVSHSHVTLVNPFPRPVEVIMCRGLDEFIGLERTSSTLAQDMITKSSCFSYNAGTAGFKYAVGVMVKKGSAIVECFDTYTDGFSSVIMFPAASKSFLGFKPVGCMEEAITFRRMDGSADDNLIAVGGTYTDANVAAWVAAAGYSGQITMKHGGLGQTVNRFKIDEDTAIFYVRDVAKVVNHNVRVSHIGLPMEAFR